jgi:hypothetical protein
MKETLEEAAESFAHNYFEMHETNNYKALKKGFIEGAKWQAEIMLAFINDEDNHTEGELGNSCIDVQTLVNFIKQK